MYTVFSEINAHGTSESKFHAGMYSKYCVSSYVILFSVTSFDNQTISTT